MTEKHFVTHAFFENTQKTNKQKKNTVTTFTLI